MRVAGAVTVAACALWLPDDAYPATLAQERGVLLPADSSGEDFEQLPTSDRTATEMACLAARRALDSAEVRPQKLGLLVHSWVYDQGPGTWTPPHRVARELNALGCPAIGVHQMSNGGGGALQLAVAHLLAEPRAGAALVTTADVFGVLPYDRWQSVPPLGDGATATVLTRGRGPQVVEAIASAGNNGLELAYPTSHPFERSVRRYEPPSRATLREISRCVRRAVDEVLDDAALYADSPTITAVLLPRIGRTLSDHLTATALPAALRDKVVRVGQRTGHLGCGDLPANLAEHPPPGQGEHHLHVSVGAGVSSTCLLTRGQ
ncbi:ketoacyl-ACP synthase III family protein [Streptomyces sp. NPDC056160]|uniref:ketoacyl-ACP synthase III family protein n=1 Tax=Streptomyces sp. NPDC056160 TaxID=3345731 RepID=UPI0035DD344B